MLLSLRQVKRRIRSIESTQKIMRAMQMVSTAKLRRTEDMLFDGKPYYFKLDALLKNVLSESKEISHPLLEERAEKKNFTLCVITSDSGLCSSYNNNIIRIAENFIIKHGANNIRLIAIGRKGFNYFRKSGINIPRSYLGLHGRDDEKTTEEIKNALVDSFISKEADEVYIAHTHFDATLRYKPKLQKLLNIEKTSQGQKTPDTLEPGINDVLKELIPRYVSTKVRGILLDAFTSEHSQRMVAMKAATDNAIELIDKLTLLRNKARQAAITTDIIEVSSAAEELKG